MAASKSSKSTPGGFRLLVYAYRSLASLRLAVVLIVVLAGVLAWATLLEADKDREYAQWYVYGSQWFVALLALLAANILAATLIRFPWRTKQIGFVITHTGLLVLLAGSIATFVAGIEGQLFFREGETADTIVLTNRSQLQLRMQGDGGWHTTDFLFRPGPLDWESDKPLDFGTSGGVSLKVLAFYRHARENIQWLADESRQSEPALQIRLVGGDGQPFGEGWCQPNPFGSQSAGNKFQIRFQQAPVQSMLKDFLEPPPAEADSQGILAVHYQDQVYPIEVKENLGKKVPIGSSGISVEIVEYFANAVFQGGGRFASASEKPENPMLDLRIHWNDDKKPTSEIAYAKNPFVNFALMRGDECPVKFWYHHPAVADFGGIGFLQTPDGKLYYRVGGEEPFRQQGEVATGNLIPVSEDFKVEVLDYLLHARRDVSFTSVELAPGQSTTLEAAALVALTIDGQSQQFWLRRNDQQHGLHRMDTARGAATLSFGYEQHPLGFALKLIDFKRSMNPGGMGDASFASDVQLIDRDQEINRKEEISMNQPLVHGKYTFYQSSFQESADGEASVLSVAYDPGRSLKYLGSLMICVGIFVMFYMRTPFGKKSSRHAVKSQSGEEQPSKRHENAVPASAEKL